MSKNIHWINSVDHFSVFAYKSRASFQSLWLSCLCDWPPHWHRLNKASFSWFTTQQTHQSLHFFFPKSNNRPIKLSQQNKIYAWHFKQSDWMFLPGWDRRGSCKWVVAVGFIVIPWLGSSWRRSFFLFLCETDQTNWIVLPALLIHHWYWFPVDRQAS